MRIDLIGQCMMRSSLLLASLLLLPFGPTLRAATVTGTLSNYSVEKTVTFVPIDRPAASADGFTITGPQPTSVRTVSGVYTATLGAGTYRMVIDGQVVTYFRVLSTDEVVTVGSPTGVAFVLTTNELWRAKSDSTDTNALFLSSKLKAGSGISLAVTDTSGTNRQVEISGTTGGTITNVALTASEMHVAGSPLSGVGGTITLALTNDLKAVEAITGTGVAARTADNTWTLRSVAAGSSKVTVANGNGVSGNPTVDLGTVAISDITGLQTEIDTKQDLITATSDVTLSNLTVLGGVTISGSGANAVDSLVVTNSLQLQNATASRFLVTDASGYVTNTVAATGTGAPVLAASPTFTQEITSSAYDYNAPVNSTVAGGAYTIDFGATNRSATLTLTGTVAYAYSGLSGTAIRSYNLWIKNAQATNCPMEFPTGTATNGIVGYNTAGKLGRLTFEYVPGWATNVFYSEAQ